MSMGEGNILKVLTKDHKPSDSEEERRIKRNGGYVYRYVGSAKIGRRSP